MDSKSRRRSSTISALVPIRKFCSKDRVRFIVGDFDLDLTYITPQVVAMAFPATGIESAWRNHIDDVARMLNEFHKDHYMVWNLSDKSYDYTKFDNNILEFGFPDHHSPPLDILFKIVFTMHNWLTADPKNVAVAHCLGGKGRTGTVICSYLVFSGMFADPLEALDFFAQKRSKIENGVKQPSQKRYITYFYNVLMSSTRPIAPILEILQIKLYTIPSYNRKRKGCSPCLEIIQTAGSRLLFTSAWETDTANSFHPFSSTDNIEWNVNSLVCGDFMILCTHYDTSKKTLMFRSSLHTAFLTEDTLTLPLDELDGIKEKKGHMIHKEMRLEIKFGSRTYPEGETDTEGFQTVYERIFAARAKQISEAPK